MTLIAGPIEKLRQNSIITRDAELLQLVGIMEANSLRLLKMIDNLLALVKSVGKGNESEKTAVLVDEILSGLLASVEHLLSERESIWKKNSALLTYPFCWMVISWKKLYSTCC